MLSQKCIPNTLDIAQVWLIQVSSASIYCFQAVALCAGNAQVLRTWLQLILDKMSTDFNEIK